MFGDFFLVERPGAPPLRGERLAFGQTNGRNEAWLRDTLHAHPELLPVKDIDPAFGPLTPLCTELRTAAGPLDLAFINPFGRLTLVECKLWRNPQARREVVAQVLDYARAISRWSYSDLQRQVAMATGRTGNVPYELVKACLPDLSEPDFVDAAAASLSAGRFLLLIAGDGIREDVGALAELINQNAAMGFSFGLVEVALYGLPGEALAIQPRAVAKTHVIERTVVVVRDQTGEVVPASSPTLETREGGVDAAPDGGRHAAYREWWQPVLDMHFDDPDQTPPRLFYPNHVRVYLPWPKTWLLAANLTSSRLCQILLVEGGESKTLLPKLEEASEELLAQLPEGSFARASANREFLIGIERPWADFDSEEDKKAWFAQTLNAFVNVFRPFLNQLSDVRN